MKKFNMHRQEEVEPVDSFITLLYQLAEHCNYRDLHDKMIQDQIVMGLWDSNLSERLQTDQELILDKAIIMARWTEAVRKQQAVVRGETGNTCTRIEEVEHSYFNKKFQVSKIPKQPTRKVAPDVASFQHIQVPGSWSYLP